MTPSYCSDDVVVLLVEELLDVVPVEDERVVFLNVDLLEDVVLLLVDVLEGVVLLLVVVYLLVDLLVE